MKTVKTILHVEDNQNDVYLLSHILRKAAIDYHLRVALDGQQVIDYLNGSGEFSDRETNPMPDLILLDLKLPKWTGLEILQWIRKHLGNRIIVVVLTSSPLESDIAEAYAYGANAFLIKPTNLALLQSMLKAVCDFWLLYNTSPSESEAKFPTEAVSSMMRASLN